jgi:hypothetical protein
MWIVDQFVHLEPTHPVGSAARSMPNITASPVYSVASFMPNIVNINSTASVERFERPRVNSECMHCERVSGDLRPVPFDLVEKHVVRPAEGKESLLLALVSYCNSATSHHTSI